MNRLELVQQAMAEIGDANPEAFSQFLERRFGMKIDPKYIPLYKATLRDKERLARMREESRALSS